MHVPTTTPQQEADVPALASLTPPIGSRFSGTSHLDHFCDPGTTGYRPPSARLLIEQARQALIDAQYVRNPGERYAQAHLAAFFAAASATRAAVEAGIPRLVTDRDADDMVRQAGQFLTIAWRSATKAVR